MKLTIQLNQNYGFSQGRLTQSPKGMLQWFPQKEWRSEFINASILGCSFIELLIERKHNPNNPIWSKSGRQEIIEVIEKSGLVSYSICLDYIIDHSILIDPKNKTFQYVIDSLLVASELDCKILVLPLLEASDLNIENLKTLVPVLREIGLLAADKNITICVECMLPADDLNNFLGLIDLVNVKAVFDTGNRVLHTPNLGKEILKLNNNIGHVHIKDKDRLDNNVILGSGMVNFSEVFKALKKIYYQGSLNFETNRGSVPINTAKFNITLCEFFNSNSIND